MAFDIKQIDKTNFKNFQMPDGSVYYGEVAFIVAGLSNIYYSIEEVPEEHKSKAKRVRHGYGIQLYGHNDSGTLVNYTGQWDMDKKNGQGNYWYPD